jgi:hypothetical protein
MNEIDARLGDKGVFFSTNKENLIVDIFAGHLKKPVRDFISTRNVKYLIIPEGLTYLLQPLDVSFNKPIKDRVRVFFDEWFGEKRIQW